MKIDKIKKIKDQLENRNTPSEVKLKLLQYLKVKDPDWSVIVHAGIDQTLKRLRVETNTLGEESRVVYRIWQSKLSSNNKRKLSMGSEPGSNTTKRSLTINEYYKRQNTNEISSVIDKKSEVIQQSKKTSLSLNDYYKRRNYPIQSCSSNNLSFIESLTINNSAKQEKNNHYKLVPISDIISSIKLDKIKSLRKDIIPKKTEIVQNETLIKDDKEFLYCHVTTDLKIWKPKATVTNYFPVNITTAPSLLNQCQEVLFKYRLCIEEVCLTPWNLLSKCIEAYNVKDLLRFETFNPQLIDENDLIWKVHYNKHFSKHYPKPNLSWRENYFNQQIAQDKYLQYCADKSIEKIRKQLHNKICANKLPILKMRNLKKSYSNPIQKLLRRRKN